LGAVLRSGKQAGRRPALIISGDLMNQYLNVIIVCPLTTKIQNYKGNVVLEPDDKNNLSQPSEVLLFHIRSVSKDRLKRKIGVAKTNMVNELKVGLNDLLTLDRRIADTRYLPHK